VLLRHLELEAAFRLGLSRISTDLAASGGAGFRFVLGPLLITAGGRVGYVAMHVDKGSLGSLWTGALLISPGVSLSYPLGERFELRARVLTVSLYYNDLWIVGWEPSMGLGVRF
jgi:hypothetical protein